MSTSQPPVAGSGPFGKARSGNGGQKLRGQAGEGRRPQGRHGDGGDGADPSERFSELAPVGTVKFVVPDEGTSLSELAMRLRRRLGVMIDPEMPRGVLVVRGARDRLHNLADVEGVARVRKAYRDPDGHEMILTDEVLVRPLSPAEGDGGRLLDLCKPWGGQDPVELPGNVWAISLKDDAEDAPLDCAQRLDTLEGVAFAEPNFLIRTRRAAVSRPEDCLFRWQWHLNNTGQGGGTKGADVDALGAWELTYGSPAIAVVVHDSGVDLGHPDLAGNLEPGWDFDTQTPDPNPPVNDAHGTACAGIIAAALNGQGVVGIAPNCKVVPLRLAWSTTVDTAAESIRWAQRNGHIISCSWAAGVHGPVTDAIENAARNGRGGRGTLVFCAAGNSPPLVSDAIVYPAKLPHVIAVGASTNEDVHAPYSCHGPELDLVAPGGSSALGISTTDIRGNWGYNRCFGEHGEYCHAYGLCAYGGTSAATPLAAGAAALMLSLNPCLSARQVKAILQETAEKIGPDGYDVHGRNTKYGYGRINARRACESAKNHMPVALLATNGKYVSVYGRDADDGKIGASSTQLDPHATFQLVCRGVNDSHWALRAHSGQYVGVASDETLLVQQSELSSGGNDPFQFVVEKICKSNRADRSIRLRHSGTSKYVKVDGGGLALTTSSGDASSQFTLLRSIMIALQVEPGGKYVRAGPPGFELQAISDSAGTWEAFILTEVSESEVVLQAVRNDLYVVESNGVLRIAKDCRPNGEAPARFRVMRDDSGDTIALVTDSGTVHVCDDLSSVPRLAVGSGAQTRFTPTRLTGPPDWVGLLNWLER